MINEYHAELKDRLTNAIDSRIFVEKYKQNLLNAEHSIDVAIEYIYLINTENEGNISTESLNDTLQIVTQKLEAINALLVVVEGNVTSASNALKYFEGNNKAQLQKDRVAAINKDSQNTAISIEFSTIDFNKATARLENGSIVEVFFKPDTDVINYDLTKSYFHTARNVW